MHLASWFVSGCVWGGLSVHCSMHGHVYERLNDHGLSVWGLPPQETRAAHWKSSLTLFLCLPFPLSVALSGRENTNRGAAFVRHKSPLPLKLPAPLFSCPNSTAIKLSWLEFRKQLKREKYGGVGGLGGHSTHTHLLLPPLVSSPLDITDLCSCWLPKIKTWLHTCFHCWSGFPKSVYWFLRRVKRRCLNAPYHPLLFLRYVCFHPLTELRWYKPWSN